MPGLASFEKKIRQEGKPFALVGVECQGSPESDIVRICKEKGVEFSVTASGKYPKEEFKGIPFSVVWDHTGKQIYKGSPGGAEAAVEKALLTAPSLYLGERTYDRLKSIAAQIQKKSGLGQAAATLRKKIASGDTDEISEAEALLAVLERYAKARTATAEAYQDSDPDKVLVELKALAKEFSGDALGTDASTRATQLSADPDFKKLAEGMKKVSAQEKLLDALQPCKACKGKSMKTGRLSCPTCKQANDPLLSQIKKALKDLAQKYTGTRAATQAEALAATL
jgi:hypothetical protein